MEVVFKILFFIVSITCVLSLCVFIEALFIPFQKNELQDIEDVEVRNSC
jgi:hypothetical protein